MIELVSIGVRVGQFPLDGVSFTVPTGHYGVLMGPSGSGKTTLLDVVCGLRKPSAGRVRLAEQDVTDWLPARRGLGYVPQDAALFPTLSVREHLAFAVRLRGWDEVRIEKRIADLSERLGVTPLLDRLPAGLSGGERQRVALGRALSFDPSILLLDEPLSSLDEPVRDELVALLRDLHRDRSPTVLHVTHNRAEAERLGQSIVQLPGKIA